MNRNIYYVTRGQGLILAALGLFACLGFLVSILTGSVDVSLEDMLAAVGGTPANTYQQIIYNIRLPRTIVAALVGMNLALSGAILQGVMKNPLADPHIIGISAGAGLMGILVMLAFPGYGYLVTPAAFLGALGAAFAIYALAWKNGLSPIRIILAGVAVSAFLNAGISALLIIYSDKVHSALMWMVGGLSAKSWPQVEMLFPYALLCGLLAMFAARHLNILQLGDDMAKGLGLSVGLARGMLSALAALAAASAVSVVGLLGFVGLIVPHAARLMVGGDYRILLPAAMLLGAGTVTFCDTIARVMAQPVEIPVGIIMAVMGAPFFLFLLRREL